MEIKRGEIYYADLSPVIGCEQGGIRPVLIIQNNVGNHYSPTVIAAAITSRRKKRMPTHVLLMNREPGLYVNSRIMLEQIRTIDCTRLIRYIGSLDDDIMQKVDRAIMVSLGLPETPSSGCCLCPVMAEKNSDF
ncbi:type II toxin-antitoxin system PemK/MazF family toxin [Hydrogeniiclostridium mannosilyticum]|uniref:type II toxin-antitoxin system PemK/MazF family toxin n=1 Tax=Hydrogeniiclostridium mannosilyticum TaxID=2764322 RepID=UPI00399C19B3